MNEVVGMAECTRQHIALIGDLEDRVDGSSRDHED